MSSKGRNLARNIGKSLRKKFGDSEGRHDQPQILSFSALPADDMSTALGERPIHINKSASTKHSHRGAPSLRMKSSSMGSIHHNESETKDVDHNDIIALTHDVKNFSDALARLKTIFTEVTEPGNIFMGAHDRLGDVLCILKNVIQHYPKLNSTDVFLAARSLIDKIKTLNFVPEPPVEELQLFCDAIDQLALSFSSCVSEYLMGDIEPEPGRHAKTKSYDDLADLSLELEGSGKKEVALLTGEELDAALVRLDAGLDLAQQRAKAWSKYARDILTYMEKKIQIESEYAKNVARLAQTMRPILSEEGFLPLQSVYCTVLSQDVEFASNFQTTHLLLQSGKFCEPLMQRRMEHDKVRRSVKDTWNREFKKMQDAVTNLRKAQALYISRQQDYERAREQTGKAEGDKLEKKKKMEEEAMVKATEAEITYKACVAEANHWQQQLEKVKGELLGKLREQIQLSDQITKSVTLEYFHLMESVTTPLPVQFHTLWESSNQYEPGSQYAEFVQRLPLASTNNLRPEPYAFQPFIPDSSKMQDSDRKSSVHSNGSSDQAPSQENSPSLSARKDKFRVPVKAWGQALPNSDTDSASGSSKSHDSSPSNTPHTLRRQHVSSLSLDEMDEEKENVEVEKKGQMKRTLTVGGEGSLDLPGILKQHQGRRNTTFGVDFQEQVAECHADIPPIITMCLAEIEKRGMHIKGMYRVSGVKSKVENLCNQFDLDPKSVDLADQHPNVICNVLKLYLRQLPEPLLTFKLYSEFILLTKDHMAGIVSPERTVDILQRLVHSLPTSNFRTCAVLIHHLQRVTAHSAENQMNASNLGIVFGPTLLRPAEGPASLTSLVDTPHQTKCVELLIASAQSIFGPGEEYQVIPAETPVESLPGQRGQEKSADVSPAEATPAISSPVKGSGKEELLLADEADDAEDMDKGPGAEFFLPGCSLGQADSMAASGLAPTPPGSTDELLGDMEELHLDEDLPDSLLPDGSCSHATSANHKPLLTPHCMAALKFPNFPY